MSQIQVTTNTQVPESTFKCVLVGDGGVGKTSYVTKLTANRFEPKYFPTLGVGVVPISFTIDGHNIRFNCWDTAGQEKFGGLRDGYYIQADCAMVFFDLSSRITFKNAQYWLRDIKKYTSNIVLIGVKTDFGNAKVTDADVLGLTQGVIPYYKISNKIDNLTDLSKPFGKLYESLNK